MTRLFDSVIEDLRKSLLRMGGLAESILEKAIESVWERNKDAAAQVRLSTTWRSIGWTCRSTSGCCGPWRSRRRWRRTCAR